MFEKGDYGDKLYIIIAGEVCVRVLNKEHEAKKKELYQLQLRRKRSIDADKTEMIALQKK